MQNRVSTARRRTLIAVAALLAAIAIRTPAFAFPPPGEACHDAACRATCPNGQDLVRIETKHCPAVPKKRPPTDIERACCRNNGGHVNCRQFPECPGRSPA